MGDTEHGTSEGHSLQVRPGGSKHRPGPPLTHLRAHGEDDAQPLQALAVLGVLLQAWRGGWGEGATSPSGARGRGWHDGFRQQQTLCGSSVPHAGACPHPGAWRAPRCPPPSRAPRCPPGTGCRTPLVPGKPTGWCPNWWLEGRLKARHNKPGLPVRSCGRYSLSQQQAEEAFLGL